MCSAATQRHYNVTNMPRPCVKLRSISELFPSGYYSLSYSPPLHPLPSLPIRTTLNPALSISPEMEQPHISCCCLSILKPLLCCWGQRSEIESEKAEIDGASKSEDAPVSGPQGHPDRVGEEGEHDIVQEASIVADTAESAEAGVQRFIDQALRQDQGSNSMPLLGDVKGQDAVDGVWKLLNSASTATSSSDEAHRGKLRRLCLKLILNLETLPDAMFLTDVQYEEAKKLGSGSFVDVFRGMYEGKAVAVKRLHEYEKMTDAKKRELIKSIYREAFLWKLLDHQHVMPLLGSGGIRQYIKKLQLEGNLPLSGPEYHTSASIWLYQVALGLAYLHSEGIVHGDLHCGNILVDAAGGIQLTDFGMALIADATSYNYASIHGGGAVFTRAPEILDPQVATTRPTLACDIYAFAFICFELYTGQRAFPEVPEVQVPGLILKGERPSRPEQLLPNGDARLDNAWSLITICWDTEPSARPPAEEVSRTMGILTEAVNGTLQIFHPRRVCSLELPPNHDRYLLLRDYFVCSDQEGSITVYSTTTGLLLHTLRDHGSDIIGIQGRGHTLISSSEDKTVRVWNLLTGKYLYLFTCRGSPLDLSIIEYLGTDDAFAGVLTSPVMVFVDLNSIAVLDLPLSPGRSQSSINDPEEWKVEDNPYRRTFLRFQCDSIEKLTVQGNVAAFWVNGDTKTVQVWDILNAKCKWFSDLDGWGADIILDTPRNIVAFELWGKLHVYNIDTGDCRHVVELPQRLENLTFYEYSGPHLVYAVGGDFLAVWDLSSGMCLRRLLGGKSSTYPFYQFDHNGAQLVGGEEGFVRLWDMERGILVANLLTGNFQVVRVMFGRNLCAAILSNEGETPQRHSAVIWDFNVHNRAVN